MVNTFITVRFMKKTHFPGMYSWNHDDHLSKLLSTSNAVVSIPSYLVSSPLLSS